MFVRVYSSYMRDANSFICQMIIRLLYVRTVPRGSKNMGDWGEKKDSHNNWWSPPELIKILKEEFPFDLDAAADHLNAICPTYITKEIDALTSPWDYKCVFVNPPYSQGMIGKFMKRAYEQHLEQKNTIVMLVPTYIDPKYWRDYVCQAHEIRHLVGRLQFLDNGVKKVSARFPSSLVIFKYISGKCYGKSPNTFNWDWKADLK